MSLTGIYKYGYGLLKLSKDELYSMDCFDFLETVEGNLLWHEFKVDETLNNFAWFTANQMMATGNMRKGTDVLDLKKDLYKSLEDIEDEKPKTIAEKVKDAEDEKEKLKARFNL